MASAENERMETLELHLRFAVAMLNAAIRICRTDRSLWPEMLVDNLLGLWAEQVNASMALLAETSKANE